MLRPQQLARLDELGLGRLVDTPVHLFRAGGVLHDTPTCRYLDPAHPPERTLLVPRSVSGPVCHCVEDSNRYPLDALQDVRDLLAAHRSAPSGAVTSSTTPAGLLRAAQRTNRLRAVTQRLTHTRAVTPEVGILREHFLQDVRDRSALHRAHLREHAPRAVLLLAASDAAVRRPEARRAFERLCAALGRLGAPAVLEGWLGMVGADLDRSERARRLSALAGSFVATGDRSAGEVRLRVLAALEEVEGLESALESDLAAPGDLVLVSLGGPSVGDFDGSLRLLLEAHVVASSGPHSLLVAPQLVVAWLGRRTLSSQCAPLPSDPVHVETAIRLWDPHSDGPLSRLEELVQVATRV